LFTHYRRIRFIYLVIKILMESDLITKLNQKITK